MASYQVDAISVALTANGATNGYATVASTAGLAVGARVWLSSGGAASLEYIITELTSTTVGLRLTTQSGFGRSDLSAYLLADNAKIDQSPQLVSGIDPNSGLVTKQAQTWLGIKTFTSSPVVPTPTSNTDAANKAYVDAVAQGLDVKNSCRVATTANITLSGAQTIDGVSVIAGNRVLVKDQSTGANNGIYVAAAGAWSRSIDADDSSEVTSGMFTFVTEGTVNGGFGWVLTTPDPITLGSTSLTFTQFSGGGSVTWASIGSSPNASGASVSGSTLTLQPANGTYGGVLSATTQSITGAKTFASALTASSGILTNSIGASSASSLSLFGAPTDAPSAIGTLLGSSTTLADAGAKLVSVKNNTSEKLYLDTNGKILSTSGFSGTTGAFSSEVSSSVASGSVAFSQLQGARFVTNGGTNTRYISDSGSAIAITGALTVSSSLAITGALSGVTTGAFSGALTSSVATGNTAFSQLVGARFITNGGTDTRYISDDGTNVTITGPVSTNGALAITGALSGVTTGAFSGTITSTVASGSNAITLQSGARIGDGSRYWSFGAAGIQAPASIAVLTDNIRNATASTTLRVFGAYADGASAVAVAIDSGVAYTNATAKIVSFRNNTVEKSYMNKDGGFNFGSTNTYKGVTGITAFAGGGQGSATALTGEINFVTTVATTADSVLLPTAALGAKVEVFNLGANSVDIFPASGGAIDALGTNAAYALAAGSSRMFCGQSATQWRSR